jgi:hypoxanthine phosphoribosyltransferase
MEKMKKKFYSWNDVHDTATSIAMQMYKDNWRPDYIVGLNRGGLPLSVILSHLTDCNHYALDVRLRDGGEQGPESNLWMAEDAFGYEKEPMNILVVDDINDTGATFNWIKQDWRSGCLPNEDNAWASVWNGELANVRFATLTENLASNFDGVRYTCHEINKAEEDVWLVYPWENVNEY